MPVYCYQCEVCEHYLEEFQRMSEEPLTLCPACHFPQLKKVFSVPNAIIKGVSSAKTVGQLAERNTKELVEKYGQDKAEEIIHDKVYRQDGRKLTLPKGAKHIEKSNEIETPWWRSGDIPGAGPRSDDPIDINKIKDPVKFVKTGETS